MPLLLDTHVLVWLMTGNRSLSEPVVREIEEAKATDDVFVPLICFWEISMLVAKRRLELDQPPLEWAHEVLRKPGISLAELTIEAAVNSTSLPDISHGDPTDHMIVATAREMGAVLVTHDRHILRYAEQGHVKVLAA